MVGDGTEATGSPTRSLEDAIARRTEITAIRNNALVGVIAYPAELTDR
ncbi:hypothetical protein [Kribbella sp. NPDC048928]